MFGIRKINVIGGGPAGLYFAILMKRQDQSREIIVVEHDGPDDTFGWGIVFSDQTFSYLEEGDRPSFQQIVAACEIWDNVDVVHKNEQITIRKNRFSSINQLKFLSILHKRYQELNIDLQFHTNIADVEWYHD